MDTLEWPRAGARPNARFAQGLDYHPFIVGLAAVVVLAMFLTAVNAGGQAWVWESVHWTVTPGLAALIAYRGARRAVGHERSVRLAVTASLVLWGLGQVVWDVQAMAGWDLIAAPSDVFFVASIVPAVWAVATAGKRHLKAADLLALRLDALVVLVAITTVILATYGRDAVEAGGGAGLLLLIYPISYSATAGAGLVTAVARRARASTYVLLAGAALQGVAWVAWLPAVIHHEVKPGTIPGYLFSVSLLLIGVGAARWPGRASHDRRMRRAAGIAREALPMAAVVVAMLPILAFARDAMGDATALGAGTVAALALGRQSLLLVDRARRTNRERITHLRELRAQAALREAADRRTVDAAWLAGLKPGDNLMETLTMLCAEIVALPQWDAAGILAIDADGALETLVSVGEVPAALEANPGLLGLVAPDDGPWIGRLGERDATPFAGGQPAERRVCRRLDLGGPGGRHD